METPQAHEEAPKPVTVSMGGRESPPGEPPRSGNVAVRFVKQLVRECLNDNITDVGAMMAYYAVLALFPMIVFVLSISLLVLDADTVHQGVGMALTAVPPAAGQAIAIQTESLLKSSHAGFAIGGALVALWGASRGIASLSGALNAMFNKQETRSWWKRQVLAISVTFGLAILVVLALGLLVVGPAAGHYLADRFGLGGAFDVAWGVGRWVGAGILVMFAWALLYKYLPDTDAPFRIFTPGAVIGVLLWLGLSALFGIYLSHFNSYESTYGTLGGAIIFLTWLWLSNITILLGAEINDVLADMRRHRSPAAAQLAAETDKGRKEAPVN